MQLAARLYEVHSAACRLAHFAVCFCGGKAATVWTDLLEGLTSTWSRLSSAVLLMEG